MSESARIAGNSEPLPELQGKFIPFSRPTIEEEEVNAVVETLRSGWLTTGKKVLEFEESFRLRLGANHAIAVNSATSGWHLTAHALGLGPGDEVIIPSITWASVANVVELLGAKPVFADVDPHSLQILPSEINRLLNSRTKAIMPVHFAGAPFDVDAVKDALAGANVHLVEDAAHAVGTHYKGREVGSQSTIAIFSFHPIKNITTGEGGMIVCSDDKLASQLRLMRFHGISKDAWKRYSKGGTPEYEVISPGFKFNMMDIQAALGISQLAKLELFNHKRTQLANLYNQLLSGLAEVVPLQNSGYDFVHSWHLYVIRLDLEKSRADRNQLINELAEQNIGAAIHFPAVHLMRYYRDKYGYTPNDLPNASLASRSILSLPLYPTMQEEDVHRVVQSLKTIVRKHYKAQYA